MPDEKKEMIRICPNCNSTNVSRDFTNPLIVRVGLESFVCNNCGHTGNFFPEVEKNKLKPVKDISKIKKTELVDNRYQNINWLWRITGPIGLLISISLIIYKSQITHQLGFFVFFPISLFIILIAYTNESYKKNKIFRTFIIILGIYSFLIMPFVLGYILLNNMPTESVLLSKLIKNN